MLTSYISSAVGGIMAGYAWFHDDGLAAGAFFFAATTALFVGRSVALDLKVYHLNAELVQRDTAADSGGAEHSSTHERRE